MVRWGSFNNIENYNYLTQKFDNVKNKLYILVTSSVRFHCVIEMKVRIKLPTVYSCNDIQYTT